MSRKQGRQSYAVAQGDAAERNQCHALSAPEGPRTPPNARAQGLARASLTVWASPQGLT